MNHIKQAILNMLQINMNYQEGESIAVIAQKWQESLSTETKAGFESSYMVAKTIFQVIKEAGYNITFIEYSPTEARNGADAPQEVYEKIGNKDIIFMPTAYSLTHTPFRMAQSKKGTRIASMPRFSLDMFEENGPMTVNYKEVEKRSKEIKSKLQQSKFVRITGDKTDIVVDIDQKNIHASSGIINKKGQYGNLPGAETYFPPTHLGKSNGYFTVPKNWGGIKPLKYQTTFHIKDGRFVDVVGETKETQGWIDKNVKPLILPEFGAGENYDVLAELGIGTNFNVTPEYMKKTKWTTLLAEKIIGSAHFANGNSKAMGGKNDVRIHIDWVVPNVKIEYNYKLKN